MRSLVLLLPIALASCGAASGADSRRDFPVAAFAQVQANGSNDVEIVRGATTSVTATGPSEQLDRLEIATRGDTLVIGSKPGWSWSNGGRAVKITVTTPTLVGVELAGSGDVSVAEAGGARFSAKLRGSGDVTLRRVAVQTLDVALQGSGDIVAAGRATVLAAALQGSGDIDTRGLEAQNATIQARGSGNVAATVRGSATVALTGSSDVTITGTTACTVNKSGSGDVRCTR